jgi:hypothetical protein
MNPDYGTLSHPGSSPSSTSTAERPAPFQFTIEGRIDLAPDVPTRKGVRIFISRYAKEWLLWHRAGCTDLSLCDVAAFSVATIHCYYLDEAPWRETRDWLVSVFGIPVGIDFLELRHEQIPKSTIHTLQFLRPTILTTPGSTKQSENSDQSSSRELLQLSSPVEHFLVLGGDNRLTLDPSTLLNSYGCRPFPRPEAITFSSSTASSISKYAFDHVEERRQVLIAEAIRDGVSEAAKNLADEVRQDLAEIIYQEPEIAQVVLSSSGTDSFLVAQGLIRLLSDAPLVSLMVGADESGTGVPLAAQERHFAVKAALGDQVAKGERLAGSYTGSGYVEISLRDSQNNALATDALDERVRCVAEENLARGSRVVIHAMNHSKLGCAGPSTALLLELKQRFGDQLHVIIDACQMRLDLDELNHYLRQGFPVIVTGSKFFTGPPLSGAVLIPQPIVAIILEMGRTLPESFNAYCAACDLPQPLRKLLVKQSSNFNLGSYFRWMGALAEMKRYFHIPALWRKKTLDDFGGKVEGGLRAQRCIELQYEAWPLKIAGRRVTSELSGRRMIFPFFLKRERCPDRQICTETEVRTIYTLLNQDCSNRFETTNARDYRLLAQRCHIGQPVKAPHPSGLMTAVLRINVGARVVSESWSEASGRIDPGLINDELWQVGVVLDKIDLLLRKMAEGLL